MSKQQDQVQTNPAIPSSKAKSRNLNDLAIEVGEGAVGAIAGAAMGAVANVPGAVVGAIIGGIVGTMAGHAESGREHDEDNRDEELDEEIGVTSDEIGAPNLDHPPTASQKFYDSHHPAPPPKR